MDLYYSLKGRIAKVYLLEGLLEVSFAVAWLGRRTGKARSR